ncbi:hypothetical protein TWF102_011126 [Orbilia oligospora]|uniref:Uncharacterized protein n=1 Tax=Orbilia oligospora TaxID=2813651 RepID=A0A7C8J808_ORBOL|nr:hypothetical protein TWF103_005335 [Orbilia oligospora]KAF3086100.1 hypothetical protein TWF102_011126 [Orbilia oligospora]KAF3095219.1 hypothetical protein TWF706_008064 [Orbilia oligospora]KAF3118565.1 hypothetical protein TWF703_004923 [Orbilia oligospora]KAF3119710.1 hypothetical protein TWF594_004605 [Orbilia oligospora]
MSSSSVNHLMFEAKKGFLISQTRIVSQSLSVTPGWEDGCCDAGPSEMTITVVENTLAKGRCFSAMLSLFTGSFTSKCSLCGMANNHVSEQIEVLYQQQRNDKTPGQDGLDVLSGQADLSDPWSIEKLPETWPNEEEYGADESYDAYKQLVGQVSSMAAGLASLRSRHERLLCLRNKISVLEKPQEKIQPNLVFKDSELALELKRMRILAAKLAYELDVSKPMQL